MMVTKNRTWTLALAACLLVLIELVLVWFGFLYVHTVNDADIRYTVAPGTLIAVVADDLHARHLIKYSWLFKIIGIYKAHARQFKAGDYLFPKGSTSFTILKQITAGKGMHYHSFMIVPGWTFRDLRAALLKDPGLKHTVQDLSDAEIMRRLGHADFKPEGLFLPETYFVTEGSEDIVVLRHAFKMMLDKLEMAWQQRVPNLPFTNAYQALIAASLVEKEAYLKTELPIIAGVLVNRLQSGMKLQFDPTVIYSIGEKYNGKIYRSDLRSPNVFNTYMHKGLPPTPISMPGLSAIQAVMHPAVHNYYYFVARGDGSHQFSRQLMEHYHAVAAARKEKAYFYNVARVQFYLSKALFTIIWISN